MVDFDNVDPNDLDPQTIFFDGDELGIVTDLPDGSCRLVLKPVHREYSTLAELADRHGGTVIDIEKPASDVKNEIIRLAEQEQETSNGDIPEPSGGQRYEISGNTYPIREALKDLGLLWDGDEKVWYTRDPEKWNRIIGQIDVLQTGDRHAEIPDSTSPDIDEEPKASGQRFRVSTDGACKNNPGAGGWAAVIEKGDEKVEIQGREPDTTSNRMELRALIEALRKLPDGSDVLMRSDSKYAINVITGDYDANANIDLVEEARELAKAHEIEWAHVKGHSGDPENERADDLAEKQARMMHNLATEELVEPYIIEGDTYPVRETLKKYGFEWNADQKVWQTRDVDDWNEAIAEVGAERIGEQKAKLA